MVWLIVLALVVVAGLVAIEVLRQDGTKPRRRRSSSDRSWSTPAFFGGSSDGDGARHDGSSDGGSSGSDGGGSSCGGGGCGGGGS